jgi:hypothetical protein
VHFLHKKKRARTRYVGVSASVNVYIATMFILYRWRWEAWIVEERKNLKKMRKQMHEYRYSWRMARGNKFIEQSLCV